MAKYTETKTFFDAYEFGENLGGGGFGRVKKCISKEDGDEYAVKIIEEGRLCEKEIKNEVFICQQLDHRNVVKLIEAFQDAPVHYLVFDIMAGGDLFDDIATRQKFSEYDACHCIEQVLKGVEYLHDKKIIHRDLKPRNVLLSDKVDKAIVKIADFGSAVMQDADDMNEFKYHFTFYYGAPEAHKEENIGPPVDMWACGMLLYVTLVGKLPFPMFGSDLVYRICNAEYSFDDDSSDPVCDVGKDLISKLLTPDQTKRYSAKAALAHSFIRDHTQVASRFHRSMTIDNMKAFNVVKREIKSDMFPKASVAGLTSPPKSKSDGAIADKTVESARDVAVSEFTEAGGTDEANQGRALVKTAMSPTLNSTAGVSAGSESEKDGGGVSSTSREDTLEWVTSSEPGSETTD